MQALTGLQNALPALSQRDRAFALSLLNQAASRGLSEKQMFWVAKLTEKATAPRPAAEQVGAIAPIVALINKARSRLQWPAILIGGTESGFTLRISIAGPGSREPGSLHVTSPHKLSDGRRRWYGRITKDGLFDASSALDAGEKEAIRVALVAFAADPAGQAAAYGKRTGFCCFCSKELTDARSTEVGYGKICAGHYGLAWGGRPGWNTRTCEAVG